MLMVASSGPAVALHTAMHTPRCSRLHSCQILLHLPQRACVWQYVCRLLCECFRCRHPSRATDAVVRCDFWWLMQLSLLPLGKVSVSIAEA